MRSINSLGAHSPKTEWLEAFFQGKDEFFNENALAAPQLLKFKLFLHDAGLIDKVHLTAFGELICDIGWSTEIAWGLILTNLAAENPQLSWYIKKMEIGASYSRKNLIDMLQIEGLKERPSELVATAYRRIVSTPLGTVLNFGYVSEDGSLCRTKCVLSDARVFLYGLFKFAEKCGDYKAFTLSPLLNDTIERDGISPTRIFGVTREEAEPMLRGLSAKYPDFIDVSFTHDLEKITLAEDKSSADV
ncbi:MAG: phosphoadenosine phosphosulfate reductase, partial [Selenomonas sp.]|nr:phosphoadenosine phosphosulfate reductase [Selenomonas sp.]